MVAQDLWAVIDIMQSHKHTDSGHTHKYESEKESDGWGGNNSSSPVHTQRRNTKNSQSGKANLGNPTNSGTGAGTLDMAMRQDQRMWALSFVLETS